MGKTIFIAIAFLICAAGIVMATGHIFDSGVRGGVPNGVPDTYVSKPTKGDPVRCLLLEGGYGTSSGDLEATKADFEANMYGIVFDTFDCNFDTPTVDQLLAYDVVLLWENGIFDNAPNVGAVIYEYVIHNAGNVVFGTFVWQDWTTWGGYGWSLMEGICPLYEAGGCEYNYDSLDPGSIVPHPVTAGVQGLWCDAYHGGTALSAGATLLATWSDGTPAVAVNEMQGGLMAAISIFPTYENYGDYSVDFGGDFHRLFENALKWAAGMPPVTINLFAHEESYSPGDDLTYTVTLANQTASNQTAWIMVEADVPGVGVVTVIRPRPVPLGPFAYFERAVSQPIPMTAPLGDYEIIASIGAPPADLWDVGGFGFPMVP